MADRDPHDLPFAEFIDDYFVECDEHLGLARHTLLALESSVGQDHVDRAALDDLFRSFHSIKGLSAMVGVTTAEQLAHQMESYLSVLRSHQARLTAAGLETLIIGVKTLEQVIAARRSHARSPDIGVLLAKLASLSLGEGEATATAPAAPPAGPFALGADKERRLATATAAGIPAWLVTFVPSPALAERGVNVNAIRERLQAIGEVIHAAPQVHAAGQIAFVFLVAGRLDEATRVAWEADGITVRPHAAAPRAAAAPEPIPAIMASNVVRVDFARLDELMRMVGELVISRSHLDDSLRRLGAMAETPQGRVLQETNLALERQLRDLREGIMRVRLVSMREVFARMQFVVRDLTREHDKKVTLTPSGQDTEIDKFVVERMTDPLLHLVRNAVSHGLESAEERVAAGKPPVGQIALRASTTGETIEIEIEDDGRGIDAAAVFARARSAGLIGADAPTDTTALLDLLCAPGFSTRTEADRASGRGVGMAVVQSAIEELGGALSMDSRLGQGTRFTIQLPLTLAIADALIVTVGGQTFAVPQVAVREVLQVALATATTLENNELIAYRQGVLPLLRLAHFFGLAAPASQSAYVLVVGGGLAAVGLVVERVLGLREVVVRPLTDPLVRVPGIAGATELGDGRVVLILDAMPLARATRKPAREDKLRRAP